MFRIGSGHDVHPFAPDRKLIIGGVEIPFDKGLAGHSDADVLVHAVCDSLLGAAALGDIGEHFPDTDPAFKNISSIKLLEAVHERITQVGYRVVNLDATIFAEQPKMMPFKPQMKINIAGALEIDSDNVNIKATTTEKLGFTGRGEGIMASCITLIEKNELASDRIENFPA